MKNSNDEFQVQNEELSDLIQRLKNMRGRTLDDGTKITYLGDGVNPGVTSVEILKFLRILQDQNNI